MRKHSNTKIKNLLEIAAEQTKRLLSHQTTEGVPAPGTKSLAEKKPSKGRPDQKERNGQMVVATS